MAGGLPVRHRQPRRVPGDATCESRHHSHGLRSGGRRGAHAVGWRGGGDGRGDAARGLHGRRAVQAAGRAHLGRGPHNAPAPRHMPADRQRCDARLGGGDLAGRGHGEEPAAAVPPPGRLCGLHERLCDRVPQQDDAGQERRSRLHALQAAQHHLARVQAQRCPRGAQADVGAGLLQAGSETVIPSRKQACGRNSGGLPRAEEEHGQRILYADEQAH
mmetsp:Transcript_614/g.2159  ORF Transcript_614/g.2159 Transcript_614/m.2159 type:complete len:217 (-) Transcript_614:3-653(-)